MGGSYSFSSGGAVYRFSRRIGRGGMGEVYLGLQEGMGGLERLVVIKRIYPHFGEDEHFTRMLLEEARLAASIRHPNVVQIHDIGRDDDGYFIAMEYLSGETLVYITRALRAAESSVPPAIACRIGAEVAAGLHCAHTATDPAGHPQPIVHRDVTPSNLIVCFNGLVKIVDFGVAKATLHEGHTRGGVKGKMSYLAPEQLYDQPIDGRTDVFQLGICLHELLTGARLFKGDNDQQRAMAVLEQEIPPPSQLDASIPKAIDEVVQWALEREPDRRPASADELRRALESAANDLGGVSAHDLGEWMRKSFAERLVERTHFERQCVAEMREVRTSGVRPVSQLASTTAELAKQDDLAPVRELHPPARVPSLSPPPPGDSDSLPAYQAGRSQPFTLTSSHGTPPPTHVPPAPAISVGRWALIGLVGVCIMVSGMAVAWRLSSPGSGAGAPAQARPAPQPAPPRPAPAPAPPAPRRFEVVMTTAPAEAIIELDGVVVGRGTYRTSLPVDGARHILNIRADGHETVALDFSDRPPPPRVVLDPVRAAPNPTRRAGDRAARRGTPPTVTGKRPVKQRPRAADSEEAALTDNPDPWADDPGKNDSYRSPEGTP